MSPWGGLGGVGPTEAKTPRPGPTTRGGVEDSPADWFNARTDLAALMAASGWIEGARDQWTRPDKDPRHGTSASYHRDGPVDSVTVFTTTLAPGMERTGSSDPGGSRTYNAFTWYTAHEHGGDERAAAAAIRAQMTREAAQRPAGGLTRPGGGVGGLVAPSATTTPTLQVVGPDDTPSASQQDAGGVSPPEWLAAEAPEAGWPWWVARIMTAQELAEVPPRAPLVEGWFTVGDRCLLWGRGGSGKTFAALDLVIARARGRREEWCGIPGATVTPGRSMILAAEGAWSLAARLACLTAAEREQVAVVPVPVDMTDATNAEAVGRLALGFGAELVVIDTLGKSLGGADENTAQAVNTFATAVSTWLSDAGVATLGVHHGGKDPTRGARGSSAFEDDADAVVEVRKSESGVTLFHRKARSAAPQPAPARVELVTDDAGPRLRFTAWGPGGDADEAERVASLAPRVLEWFARHPGASTRAFREGFRDENPGVSNALMDAARDALVVAGQVRAERGGRNAFKHYANRPETATYSTVPF